MKLVREYINEATAGINPIKYVPSFEGNINLSDKGITELPKDLPKKITGSFYCYDNNLTSLEGAPTSVGVNFYCDKNNLTSLKGSPRSVGKDFYCNDNDLTSLEGAPTSVSRSFYYHSNNISKKEVMRYFQMDVVQGIIYSDYEINI